MGPTLMPKLVMILDNGGDENKKNGKAKAFSACVANLFHMLGALSFIVRKSFLFGLSTMLN